MPTGRKNPLTDASLIQVALPRDAAKHLERGLGCSPRQARRIANTGYIPERLWESAAQILERALDAWEEKIRQERQNLKAIRCARMAARVQDRLDDSPAQVRAMVAEPDEGQHELPLIDGEAA